MITGAFRAIGHHLARHLYLQGYHLILLARDAQALASFAATLDPARICTPWLLRAPDAQGIKVTTLCPDVVDTDMVQGSGLTLNEMLSSEDICRAVDFVMSLSPAAVVEQLTIGRQYRPRKPA
nr:hypothetical protein [Candidatus Erwinia dacicola]